MRRSLAALTLAALVVGSVVAPAVAADPAGAPIPTPAATPFPEPTPDPTIPGDTDSATTADPGTEATPGSTSEPTPTAATTADPTSTGEPAPTGPTDPDTDPAFDPGTLPTADPATDPAETPTGEPPPTEDTTAADGSASPSAPTDPPAAPAGPTDEYIVVLKSDASTAAVVDKHHRQRGTRADRTFRNLFRGFSAHLDKTQRAALLKDPNVAAVVPDEPIELAAQTVPTGIARVGTRQSAIAAIDGQDQRVDADVAIVDTGVSPHPDLNVAGGINCVPNATTGATNPSLWQDWEGHGTHVAGTVAALDNSIGVVGVAPGARIWSVRILDGSGNGKLSWYVCGLDWIAAQRDPSDANRPLFEAVNMSVTKSGSDDGACGSKNDDILHAAICRVVNQGITVVAAAANDARNASTRVPASYNEVITVSALADKDGRPGGLGGSTSCPTWGAEKDDTFADFSNYGADVDIMAPGKCIISTYYKWPNGNPTYAWMSGTSMATPAVTGAVALYKASRPTATPTQVREALQYLGNLNWNTATDPDSTHEKLLDVSRLGKLGTFYFTSPTPQTPITNDGGTTALPITIDRSATYFERVGFRVTGLPSGWSASWAPSSFIGWTAESTTLNVTVPPGTANGTYQVRVTASGVGTTREKIANVIVGKGGAWTAIAPVRRLDTRTATGLSGVFRAGEVRTFQVTGNGIPDDAIAITGNLAVTRPSQAGYVSLGPTMVASPSISTINVAKGQTIANGVTVQLADGKLSAVYGASAGASTHLILDVTGYFRLGDAATWQPVNPARILDTRTSTGLVGSFRTGVPRLVQVTGRGGVPSNAVSVTGNVTVVGATKSGHLSLGPSMSSTPSTSTVNFPTSIAIANNVTMPLDSSGRLHAVIVTVAGGQAHVVFDVTGYYVSGNAGARWYPARSRRIVDTRSGVGISSILRAGVPRQFTVTGSAVPRGTVGITANLAAVKPTARGYLSAGPTIAPVPSTSSVNFTKGKNVANGIVLRVTSGGTAQVVYGAVAGTTSHVILDVTGYFARP